MKYDYLVESADRQSFDLVPCTDEQSGLAWAVTAERLPGLLAETDLTNSLVAQYASQLAMNGTVARNLLLTEGPTIAEELDALYEKIKRVEIAAETGLENDLTLQGPDLPEDEKIWLALKGYAEVKILDRNGYSDLTLLPFDIDESDAPKGTFVHPMHIPRFPGLVEIVHSVEGLQDNPHALYGMEQYAVTRDGDGKAVSVSDKEHLTVGWLNESNEFVPYATLLEPFRHLE